MILVDKQIEELLEMQLLPDLTNAIKQLKNTIKPYVQYDTLELPSIDHRITDFNQR